MANLFLKLEGIDGESKDSTYSANSIIDSVSFGMSASGTYGTGGGGGGHNVHLQDVTVAATMDKAVIPLAQKLVKGTHIASAEVICRKTAGDSPIEYMKYKMTDVVVTSMMMSHSTGSDLGMVSYSFNFKKIEMTYTPQKDDQSPDSELPMSYDQESTEMT